jgi:flavin-dependent dehydrogenase
MLPKRHPLNSFVADGFLVSGDAAYVAVSSSLLGFSVCMPQLVIAAEEISRLLTEGGYLSRTRLWNINTRFFSEQGLALAVRNAMQPALLHTTASEDDFFFHHNLFFSEQTLSALWQGEAPVFSAKETLRDALALLGGVLTGKVRVAAAGWFIRNVQNGMRAVRLYAAYPASEARLDAWVSRAEAFWKKCRKTAHS